MSLSIGIVGLPNVGKSTLFNALTKAQNAQAANYPFCTIEPNKATVAVPDKRVDALTAKAKPQKTIHASVDSSISPVWCAAPARARAWAICFWQPSGNARPLWKWCAALRMRISPMWTAT